MDRGSLNTLPQLLFLLLCSAVIAPTIQASEQIEQQAKDYLLAQIKPRLQPHDRVTMATNPLDSRLQLSPCHQPLSFTSTRPITPGAFTLKSSCSSPRPWTIYLSGSLEIYRPIVVSLRPIGRDTPLDHTLITLEERPISRLREGYYTQLEPLLGYQSRRNIAAGLPLRSDMLLPPLLVKAGDVVTIRAHSQSMTVEAAGIALQDGRLHEQIDVRNSRSDKIIRARITGRGLVSPP
ncbi:MAG TPA: flagellar basal body P-ring formation chaperone FlgA [Motiliproteus sp.]